MTEALVIFSRFDSTRLPGKALMDVGGRPLLGRCIDRARLVPGAPRIIVATSDRAVDDVIAAFAAAEGVSVFRGSADDVAGRALACCRQFRLTRFARICGDSPFLSPELIGALLAVHRATACAVACNVHPRTFPPGLSTEIVAASAMECACASPDPEDHEHLTRFFYRNAHEFRVVNLAAQGYDSLSRLRLVVDTAADLARASLLAERLGDSAATAGLDAVLALAASVGNP